MFEIKTTLTERQVADQFVTAMEGGSNYWLESAHPTEHIAKITKSPWYDDEALYAEPFKITLGHDEGSAESYITRDSIQIGLNLMAQKSAGHFADMVEERGDAITADVFIQYCAFGEIVYG